MAQTGKCWYCGSEDVEDYTDGSHECMECGTTWGGRLYISQHTINQPYNHAYTRSHRSRDWDNSMLYYRAKWQNQTKPRRGIFNDGTNWYDAEVQVTNGCAVPAVLYIFVGVIVYGFLGLMIYVICSD